MDGLILPCIIQSIRSMKDGSVSVTLETQELSPAKAGELFSLRSKLAAVYISPKDTIDQREINQVDKIDPELQGKTQSQRLRNVLFLLYQQDSEGHKQFDSYYKQRTETLIEHFKQEIK